jgi:hypothetical protein
MAKEEITGKRDSTLAAHLRRWIPTSPLSIRHRLWGDDCPALDIDQLLEYDNGIPAILVEYKCENAPEPSRKHPSYAALIGLAERAQIPMFFVRYAADFSWWLVTPWNALAKQHLREQAKMTELDFVGLLYRIRGRELPGEVAEAISATMEWT